MTVDDRLRRELAARRSSAVDPLFHYRVRGGSEAHCCASSRTGARQRGEQQRSRVASAKSGTMIIEAGIAAGVAARGRLSRLSLTVRPLWRSKP
jgi:hypothetical protein